MATELRGRQMAKPAPSCHGITSAPKWLATRTRSCDSLPHASWAEGKSKVHRTAKIMDGDSLTDRIRQQGCPFSAIVRDPARSAERRRCAKARSTNDRLRFATLALQSTEFPDWGWRFDDRGVCWLLDRVSAFKQLLGLPRERDILASFEDSSISTRPVRWGAKCATGDPPLGFAPWWYRSLAQRGRTRWMLVNASARENFLAQTVGIRSAAVRTCFGYEGNVPESSETSVGCVTGISSAPLPCR